MIPALEVARAAVAIYDPTSPRDATFSVAGIYATLRRYGDEDLLTFRGSDNLPDWLRDFDVFGLNGLASVPKLGQLHAGMWEGMTAFYGQVTPRLRKVVNLGGHSLGAIHARYMNGLLTAGGAAPVQRITMGEPQGGMQALCDLTASTPGPSFTNRCRDVVDPVTLVPFKVPPLLEFRHPPQTYLDVTPASDLPTALHHSELYLEAITVYYGAGAA